MVKVLTEGEKQRFENMKEVLRKFNDDTRFREYVDSGEEGESDWKNDARWEDIGRCKETASAAITAIDNFLITVNVYIERNDQ